MPFFWLLLILPVVAHSSGCFPTLPTLDWMLWKIVATRRYFSFKLQTLPLLSRFLSVSYKLFSVVSLSLALYVNMLVTFMCRSIWLHVQSLFPIILAGRAWSCTQTASSTAWCLVKFRFFAFSSYKFIFAGSRYLFLFSTFYQHSCWISLR